jgi:lauroyl/myristoyl acyltransferase
MLTLGSLRLGQVLAQRGDERTVERIRQVLWGFYRVALPLRRQLEKNMRQAGVYRDGLPGAYFERATDQMTMLANALQTSSPEGSYRERFQFDDSFRLLEQAYAEGKGVISIAPHICGYPLYAGVVSPRIPCVIFLRRNKDPRKMCITETTAKAGNAELVCPPEDATKSQRLQVAIDVLRQGRMMFLTPDTPRKPDEGVRVTMFSRTAYFPTGVFVMSLRTGAPVVPVWWHWQDGFYHIHYGEPIELRRGGRLQAKAEAAMQHWAADADAFLRRYPEMWWNWLDKRWTRILTDGSLVA